MLISPIRIYELLSSLLEADETAGPHTALLITPSGQLLAHATLPDGEEGSGGDGEEDGDCGEDEADGADVEGDGASEGAEAEEGDDEPWLEGPERLRLLLGLASQWEEDASPRVECELGRLFLRPIALPENEVPPDNAAVPTYPQPVINSFVLVLNGMPDTPWSELANKADQFLSSW